MVIPVLLLTGPVGVGKTSVLSEIAYQLAESGIPHASVDLDCLSEYFPRPASDPFGTAVALRNLTAVWRNYREAGAERLVVAQVITSEADLARLGEAVPGAGITVIRLCAPVAVLQARVREREIGAGLEWHVQRAAELAVQFERLPVDHHTVDAGTRSVRELAREALTRAGWLSG